MKRDCRVALVGNPNAGKSYLFNKLTGSCSRVANYPGATVERSEGFMLSQGHNITIVDLPGIYSLNPLSRDENITVKNMSEGGYDLILNVVDSTNLERNLFLTQQLLELDLPVIAILSKIDLSKKRGVVIDIDKLPDYIGCRFLCSEGLSKKSLLNEIYNGEDSFKKNINADTSGYEYIEKVCEEVVSKDESKDLWTDRFDSLLTHRWLGIPIFFFIMFLLFKFTFVLGSWPSWVLQIGFDNISQAVGTSIFMSRYPLFSSLLRDGIITGVGGVLVFVPNIFFLFMGISFLEESGYISRAAFIMDRLMHKMGLHGKSFISLLLGLGCTVPAIMSTRTIENRKDRLTTIFILPMISCSARMIVYTMLVAIFFSPAQRALVLWSLYFISFVITLLVSRFLRKRIFQGESDSFVMEMPSYIMPVWRSVSSAALDKSWCYVRKVGTVILGFSILFWVIFNFPFDRAEGEPPAIRHFTKKLEVVVRPLGFDDKIATALLSSIAGKEVFVSQLGIMHSVENNSDSQLADILQENYSSLTAYCIMIFIMLSTPCASTIAVAYRESGSLLFTVSQLVGLTAIAYFVTWIIYNIGLLL